MFSRQVAQRATQRLSAQVRSPTIRSRFQRRLAHNDGGEPPLTGAADNAFNRERRAVKAHAAASAGQS